MTEHYPEITDDEAQELATKHGMTIAEIKQIDASMSQHHERVYMRVFGEVQALTEVLHFLPETPRTQVVEVMARLTAQLPDSDDQRQLLDEVKTAIKHKPALQTQMDRLLSEIRAQCRFDDYIDDAQPLLRLGFLAGAKLALSVWIGGLHSPEKWLAEIERDLRELLDQPVQ
jgi:type I site-specific restriction endonuclease